MRGVEDKGTDDVEQEIVNSQTGKRYREALRFAEMILLYRPADYRWEDVGIVRVGEQRVFRSFPRGVERLKRLFGV